MPRQNQMNHESKHLIYHLVNGRTLTKEKLPRRQRFRGRPQSDRDKLNITSIALLIIIPRVIRCQVGQIC